MEKISNLNKLVSITNLSLVEFFSESISVRPKSSSFQNSWFHMHTRLVFKLFMWKSSHTSFQFLQTIVHEIQPLPLTWFHMHTTCLQVVYVKRFSHKFSVSWNNCARNLTITPNLLQRRFGMPNRRDVSLA